MHGTLTSPRPDAPHPAVLTFFCCVRMKAQAEGCDARYSAWWPVSPQEYAALLRREGYPVPVADQPLRDFSSGPLEGRAIYQEHQIAGWDKDLRALYAAHRASPSAIA